MKTNDGRERVAYFSNPYVKYKNTNTGVVGVSHNVRNINANAPTVEDFRFTTPNMTVSITGGGTKNNGDPLTFRSYVVNGNSPFSYRWQLDTGSGYFGNWLSSILNYTMPTDKNLSVKLTVTGSDGRSVTTSTFVQNSFIGGGCTQCPDLEDFSNLVDSRISNESKDTVEPVLYPNPATNTIYIDNLDIVSGLNRYEIFDMSGTMVKNLDIHEPEYIAIDISSLSKGVYMLKLLGGRDSLSYKFIKQ